VATLYFKSATVGCKFFDNRSICVKQLERERENATLDKYTQLHLNSSKLNLSLLLDYFSLFWGELVEGRLNSRIVPQIFEILLKSVQIIRSQCPLRVANSFSSLLHSNNTTKLLH
jgi:hypothetical protein